MDIRDYWHIVRKRWIAIVLVTLLGGGLALAYSMTATKVYSATAQILMALGGSSKDGSSEQSLGNFALERMKSYPLLVDGPAVLDPVIEELGLDETSTSLAAQVSVTNPPQTLALNVTATGTDPEAVAALANTTAKFYGQRIEEFELLKGATNSPVKASLNTPATVPSSPVSPQTKVNVALGLLLGLGIGLAWAVVREQMDNTVKTPDTVGEVTGSLPLGVVAVNPDADRAPLVALNQRSGRAEAFRTIRTNLRYVDVDNPPKAIAVTSAVSDEGKTTVAANLAITFAQAGKSVCLVGADLRKPRLAEYLGLDSTVGVTDVLTGAVSLDEGMVSWNRGLLSVLPGGTTPPNPSELLSSQHMEALLSELRDRFDIVVIDSAPTLPVADGAIVGSLADGAIVVVHYGDTTRDQLEKSVNSLEQVGTRILGAVLNFVPERKHGYGYGYGYGYGEDEETGTTGHGPEPKAKRAPGSGKAAEAS